MEQRKKKKIIYTIIFLFAAAVLASAVSVVYAKYINEKKYDGNQVKAEPFCFTLDLLDASEPDVLIKTIDIYNDDVTMPFYVRNYLDLFTVNPYNISYNISWTFLDANGASISPTIGDKTLTMTNADGTSIPPNSDAIVTLTTSTDVPRQEHGYSFLVPSDWEYEDGSRIELTVQSLPSDAVGYSSYTKTMKLIFVFHTYQYELEYYMEDSADAQIARLVIASNVDIPQGRIIIDWSEINADGYVLGVDTPNAYVLNAGTTLTLETNSVSDGGWLDTCMITQNVESMLSFEILFFKTPREGDPYFVCWAGHDGFGTVPGDPASASSTGLTEEGKKGINLADGQTTYVIKLKKGG